MKKKGILSFSIFLVLVAAIAIYCWPSQKTWFPEREKLELNQVYVYEKNITDLLSDEQKDAILDQLTGLKTKRILGFSSSFSMDDYPVSLLLAYSLGTSDQDICEVLLGKTNEVWSTLGSDRLYQIVDGDALQAQLTEFLSAYYEKE